MRIRTGLWGKEILETLRRHLLPSKGLTRRKTRLSPTDICEIELALFALLRLFPHAAAKSFWVHLLGYDFALAEIQQFTNEQKQIIGILRHFLLQFKNRRNWTRALKLYRELNERVRLFDIDEHLEQFTRRSTSVCPEREERYLQLLSHPLPYAKRNIVFASPGTYLYSNHHRPLSFTIPADLPPSPPPVRYKMKNRHSHQPLIVRWRTLLATARWMDKQHKKHGLPSRNWFRTLHRIEVRLSPSEEDPFLHIGTDGYITFDKTQHFVGIVGAGKTTFMDVVAVWAALRGMHITLVVGDVMAVFDRIRLFRQLGLRAAPVIGASNRKRHRQRLHRVLATEHAVHPMQQEHEGFDYTGTVCLLHGLQKRLHPHLEIPPCLSLLPSPTDEVEDEESLKQVEEDRHFYACPLFSACSYHQAQHDLVTAPIWIATPASLIYTHVAPQIHSERMRFIEMVYRQSDLVIVDEADRVQVQLDALFSPGLTLIGREKEPWLINLHTRVYQTLNQELMEPLQYAEVALWVKALDRAVAAFHVLYSLLLTETTLLQWITHERDYFNGLTLLEQLAIDLCHLPKTFEGSVYDHPRFEALWPLFHQFLDDPLGEKENHALADLTRQALSVDDTIANQRLQAWLQQHLYETGALQQIHEYVLRLKFSLVLHLLADSLNTLVLKWKQAEVILGLQGSSSLLFHSPPDDYASLLPDAPMGNILGFQYLRSPDNPKGSGDLRFFRCMGVGRWLLHHFHDFLFADGLAGPHTLLLSGTSWAGISPSYHLQLPVTGVLLPPPEEMEEIAQSVFLLDIQYNPAGSPISISGKHGQKRLDALQEMLDELSREQHMGPITLRSKLEVKKDELPAGRKRILLVVGSYDQAEAAYLYLLKNRPGWEGEMAYLVSDDDEFESEWRGKDPRLRRGLVHQLTKTKTWLLIAPLLAIERGHNILNDEGKAALGAVYFLVRPHPRPNDINYTISCMNAWYMQKHLDTSWLATLHNREQPSLEALTLAFRGHAFGEWRRLLRTPLSYSILKGNDLSSLIWTQLVSLWQVIGRLVRGGCAAQVMFCDAKFAPQTARLEVDESERTSLLVGMKKVLQPFFDETTSCSPRKRDLVCMLYGPLYHCLERMEKRYGKQL